MFNTLSDPDFALRPTRSMSMEEVLQDIFYIQRVFGIFPLDCKFLLSKKMLSYCCLLKFLSTFGAVLGFTYFLSEAKNDENISFIITLKCLALMSDVADIFFSTIWWVLKQHRVSFLIKSIKEIQRKEKIILERQRIRLIHYLLLLTTVFNIATYFFYKTEERGLAVTFAHFSDYLISSAIMCFVGNYWDILHLIRHLFRESTQLCDESSVITYGRFLAICDLVNDLYGPQLLFSILILFLQIIIYFYILLVPLYPGLLIPNLVFLFLMINSIMAVGSIILACDYFINQERNFNNDLRRRMIEENSRVLLRNERLNFHFFVGQETVFTACGFFVIDKSLICSMISAATTYLVIVLQHGIETHNIPTNNSHENIYNITQL